MTKFFAGLFHKILVPHCDECAHNKACTSCETLRSTLAEERFEKKQLLERLLELTSKKDETLNTVFRAPVPVPTNIPWSVKRQQLEHEARIKAASMTTEELEKELNIESTAQ